MNCSRSLGAASACACLLSSCISVDVDEVDRGAFFYGARVRHEFDGVADHDGGLAELGWSSVESDEDELETSIGTATLGAGIDSRFNETSWGGLAGGVAWQRGHFEATPDDVDGDDDFGPYVAIQGGWNATEWLEVYARTEAALFLEETSSMFSFEAGPRLHLVDHVALFVGWRYTRYDLRDLDGATSIETVELDASGLVLGLELAF